MTSATIKFVKGKEYEVTDWCGMFVKRGIYVGLFENRYIDQKVFVFERTDKRADDENRFMGCVVSPPHIDNNRVTFSLLAKFYGPNIQELNSGAFHENKWNKLS